MRIVSGVARGTKLYTLEGENTRPTLDRVKESVFNIIQNQIKDSVFLDLFSGSGAIGLEAASRGAKKVILCDKAKEAVNVIIKNISKTHLEEKVKVYNLDFKVCLNKITNEKVDIVYLDPPYKTDYIQSATQLLLELDMLKQSSIIIAETDEEQAIDKINNETLEIFDKRKYGRAIVAFLRKKAKN